MYRDPSWLKICSIVTYFFRRYFRLSHDVVVKLPKNRMIYLPHCIVCNAVFLIAKPSVRPSDCPSVRHTRKLWQNKHKFYRHSYTIWKENRLFFPTRKMVGGGRPFLPENLGQTHPTSFKKRRFPIYIHLYRLSPYI